jgi:hypothetical protein
MNNMELKNPGDLHMNATRVAALINAPGFKAGSRAADYVTDTDQIERHGR